MARKHRKTGRPRGRPRIETGFDCDHPQTEEQWALRLHGLGLAGVLDSIMSRRPADPAIEVEDWLQEARINALAWSLGDSSEACRKKLVTSMERQRRRIERSILYQRAAWGYLSLLGEGQEDDREDEL
jgi:hypothetical protein